jgi:uncharacterized membrane protein
MWLIDTLVRIYEIIFLIFIIFIFIQAFRQSKKGGQK